MRQEILLFSLLTPNAYFHGRIPAQADTKLAPTFPNSSKTSLVSPNPGQIIPRNSLNLAQHKP